MRVTVCVLLSQSYHACDCLCVVVTVARGSIIHRRVSLYRTYMHAHTHARTHMHGRARTGTAHCSMRLEGQSSLKIVIKVKTSRMVATQARWGMIGARTSIVSLSRWPALVAPFAVQVPLSNRARDVRLCFSFLLPEN